MHHVLGVFGTAPAGGEGLDHPEPEEVGDEMVIPERSGADVLAVGQIQGVAELLLAQLRLIVLFALDQDRRHEHGERDEKTEDGPEQVGLHLKLRRWKIATARASTPAV